MVRRENIVRVVLTDEEAEKIKEAAKKLGIPTAVWVRMVALEKANG